MNSAVTIKNLYKQYPKGVVALDNVSFSINEGDFFALLGPNGAGKSTLIGIMVTLVNKTRGEVRVFGEDLDKRPDRLKRHIGLVPQEYNFNIFEPVEQILLNNAGYFGISSYLAKQRSEKWLKRFQLWDKRHVASRKLSGGMKRRLMIARAMMHNPKLLILDEPTAGVDIEIRRDIWSFLKEINEQGTTIILTTHYLEEAEELCKKIAIINHGQLIENVTMLELLNRLRKQSFVLELAKPLSEIKHPLNLNLDKVSCQILDEQSLEILIEKGQNISAVFSVLIERGIQVSSLRSKSNRLEALFMEMIQNES